MYCRDDYSVPKKSVNCQIGHAVNVTYCTSEPANSTTGINLLTQWYNNYLPSLFIPSNYVVKDVLYQPQ